MHLKKFSIQSKLLKAQKARPLQFIEYGQLETSNLYDEAFPLTQVSLQTKAQIKELQKYASENKLIGLSGIQGGYFEKYFILSQEAKLTEESIWKTADSFSLDSYKGQQTNEIEYSPTFPMIDAQVPRYKSIKVRYFNEEMDEIEETIQNFESKAFQHFYDFLMNKDLLNWRVNQGNVNVSKPYQKQLKKFSAVLDDYKKQVLTMKENFPELFEPRQLSELNKTYEQLTLPSFEQDIVRRLLKNIGKDLSLMVTNEEKNKQN